MNERLFVLTPSDAPAAIALSTAANWNQSGEDWRRVIELEPEGCFGIEADGELVATATTTCYGTRLAWIGMVLTRPDCRGRGYARRLMERSLEYLEGRGVDWIKLDATDMGYPLYARMGFVDECKIERWRGTGAGPAPAVDDYRPDPCLDLEAFGADRSAVLRMLAPHGAARAGSGFAMGRSGRVAAFFGPCVARDAASAETLLRWFLATRPGEPVCWDLLPDNAAARALAESHGFTKQRLLVRMIRPGRAGAAPIVHDDSLVFAGAGFEYG